MPVTSLTQVIIDTQRHASDIEYLKDRVDKHGKYLDEVAENAGETEKSHAVFAAEALGILKVHGQNLELLWKNKVSNSQFGPVQRAVYAILGAMLLFAFSKITGGKL